MATLTRNRVVLDPGHGGSRMAGGSSPNHARGPNGLLEKDVVLDVARRVARRLADAADVRLTRESDDNLSLAARARTSRELAPSVFVSLHINGSDDPSLDGAEAWVARDASAESEALARRIVARVAAAAGVAEGPVRRRDLGVLLTSRQGARTAACLVELAYLTNPAEAVRLADSAYRDTLADAVQLAIREQLGAPTAPATRATSIFALEATRLTPARTHTPSASAALFRCAPTPVAVAPATLLPTPSTTTAADVRTALTAVGVPAAALATFATAGGIAPLEPFAAAFGADMLTELLRRLRYTPAQLTSPPHGHGAGLNAALGVRSAAEILAPRLLLCIPGHFRELARLSTDAREAHVLESLGWLLMHSVRDDVRSATQKRWWIPPAPDFVTALSSTLPPLGQQVQRLVMRTGQVDNTLSYGDYNARFQAWDSGLAGKQWKMETGVNTATPGAGRPFYSQIVTIQAGVDTAATRTRIQAAWDARVRAVNTAHGAGTEASTAELTACHNEVIDPLGVLSTVPLGGVEFTTNFPVFEPTSGRRGLVTSVRMLSLIAPTMTQFFQNVRELGWNDLLFQTAGAACFRGNKVPGDLARRAAAAQRMSNHGAGLAIDVLSFENPQGTATSTHDPRIVALFEAYHFRWGRCFQPPSSPDPHHFEYCGTAC